MNINKFAGIWEVYGHWTSIVSHPFIFTKNILELWKFSLNLFVWNFNDWKLTKSKQFGIEYRFLQEFSETQITDSLYYFVRPFLRNLFVKSCVWLKFRGSTNAFQKMFVLFWRMFNFLAEKAIMKKKNSNEGTFKLFIRCQLWK